jgi:hypothetical protein
LENEEGFYIHGNVAEFARRRDCSVIILVKEQTPEYALADEIYSLLELVEIVLRVQKKVFWIVGSLADNDIGLRKKSDDE